MNRHSKTMAQRLTTGILAMAVALILAPPPASAQDQAFRARRVWKGSPEPFCCGNTMVSKDGRYVPGWDSYTGNLQYLDMLENRWIRVTDKGTWDTSDSFSLNPMFSPDGQWIAHTWSEEGEPQLRLDRRDGSEHRVLLRNTWPERSSGPLDWAPDGRSVLVVTRTLDPERVMEQNRARGEGGWDRLVLIPVDGGEPVVLKEVELQGPVDGRMSLTPSSSGLLSARFSPDGRWVAYQRYEEGFSIADIYVLSVDGGTDRPLVTQPGNDRLLGWTPDGSGILFHSERDARPGIWRLRVRDGSPVGEPQFVQDDVWGLEPMGMGDRGFYYLSVTETPQVQTLEVDFERGEVVSLPSPVRDPGSGSASRSPAWSPDGRQLAFIIAPSRSDGLQEVAVRSLETGEVRSFPLKDTGVQKIAWGSDPLSLLFNGIHGELGAGIFRLDLRSGEVTPVLVGDDAPGNLEDTFKRDGRTLAVPFRGEDGERNYRVRDLETGHEMVLETHGWSSILAFPGGDRYAVWTERGPRDGGTADVTLSEVGLDGSQRVIWQQTVQGRFMQSMAITPDGGHILVRIEDQIGIVDVDTGDLRILKTPTGEVFSPLRHMVIQPNGNRIAAGGSGEPVGEIWVIEGLR